MAFLIASVHARVLACSQAVYWLLVALHGIALRYSSYGALHLFYIRTFMIAYLHPTYVIHIYTIKCLHAAGVSS
jgi:hypothetical protein